MTLTRRRFLQALAAVGGAGAVLGAMEALDLTGSSGGRRRSFTPPAPSDFALRGRVNDTRVLVLGAGISGLVAAYELEKGGYECELLEARDRPGGRSWTVRGGTTETDTGGSVQTARFEDGNYMNPGPARIAQHHMTLDYCRELGVPVEVFVNSNPDAYFFNTTEAGATGALADRPIRQRAARADHIGYVSELLAKAVSQSALDEELTPADRDRLVDFLRGFGALGPGDRYSGSERRGRAEKPLDLGDLLASAVGFYFPFDLEWDQAMPMFQPVGGMDRIAHALADSIEGRIRYEAEVSAIATAVDRVRVSYRDGSGDEREAEADYCVCTIPPTVLRGIPTNLPEDVRLVLRSLEPMPTGKLGLEYGRRFWEEDDGIFGGITATTLDIANIWYPSSGYLGRSGVLIGYYTFFDAAREYGALPPAERERRALARGRLIHGDPYVRDFRSSFSVDWTRVRHSLGGWALHPGLSDPSYRRLLEPQGRLWLAGDHLSASTAWQHGAIESARRAVTALHAHAMARP